MKKIALYLLLCASASLSACGLFEIDNYDAPAETLTGMVVDVATGEPVLTDQGGEGIRVRLLELSYKADPAPFDFNCKPDGTFNNTKIFKGNYNVVVDGPFVPLVRKDPDGNLLPDGDQSWTGDIDGTRELKFEVQPFLKVELDGSPAVSNGKISAKVKVTRAVSVADFQAKVEPMYGAQYSSGFTNVTDIQLFVSYSSSVGYRARDSRWSTAITYSGSSFNSLLGTWVNISSSATTPIPSGRTVFIRAAARINLDTPKGSGTRRWNYSEPLEVLIP